MGGVHLHALHQRIGEGFQFLAPASELRYLLTGLKDALNEVNWTASPHASVEAAAAGTGTVRH